MKIQFKESLLVLVAETGDDIAQVTRWGAGCDGHVFALTVQHDRTLLLRDLGPRPDACREPINVVSTAPDEAVRLISNLAHTPFRLHGREYASVEGFWQGLKFPDEESRRQIAQLHGKAAKLAAHRAPEAEVLAYQGARVRVGCPEHWALLRQACWAKFSQHDAARNALLGTGERPLTHRVRRDSQTIPGVVMADIWMGIRARLRDAPANAGSTEVIGPFDGPYRWLSNFHPAPVMLDGMLFPTVEHAYQAAKTLKRSERSRIQALATPGQAKRASRELDPRRPDWPEIKLAVMEDLLRQKFADPELRQRLRETWPQPLVELNTWGDVFWGVCGRVGENHLGKLLMKIRAEHLGEDALQEQNHA